jgi:hypothetical protein
VGADIFERQIALEQAYNFFDKLAVIVKNTQPLSFFASLDCYIKQGECSTHDINLTQLMLGHNLLEPGT